MKSLKAMGKRLAVLMLSMSLTVLSGSGAFGEEWAETAGGRFGMPAFEETSEEFAAISGEETAVHPYEENTESPEELTFDAEETPQTAAPEEEETPQTAAPDAEETPQTAAPEEEETLQTAAPEEEETPQTAAPEVEETLQTAASEAEEMPQTAAPATDEAAGTATSAAEEPAQIPAEEKNDHVVLQYLTDAEAGTILAEKVPASQLQPGDRFVIVYAPECLALSRNVSGTRLAPVNVTITSTPTRRVLTELPESAAVFELIPSEANTYFLKSENGYLTTSETGNSLHYSKEPQTCSTWQFVDDSFLYNPNAAYREDDAVFRNFYLEYYSGGRFFSAYGKNDALDEAIFTLEFYRLGNSNPQEEIADDGLYRLPVFHTSDIHGYLADTSGGETGYLLAYISDKVKDVRGYGAGTRRDLAVLLDGGDIYQGNTLSNLLDGESLAAAFEIMGYDAVTVGNHDFDWGIENTVDADGTMQDYDFGSRSGANGIPVVISNLYRYGDKTSFYGDYIILQKTAVNAEGRELPVKIGVIGFAGDYGLSIMYDRFAGAGFEIRPDYGYVNALAGELEQSGMCDATILLTHEEAGLIAENLGSGTAVDAVLGGHTHRIINGVTAWGLRYMEPSCNGKAYSYLELAFADGEQTAEYREVSGAKVISVPVSETTEKHENVPQLDPEMVALTKETIEQVSSVLTTVIGFISESAMRYVYLPESGSRSTTYGNWAASILARIVGADAAFVNNGGLRLDFPLEEGSNQRAITLADIYAMFPFDNKVFCYELTYEDLLKALEYSLGENGKTLLSQIVGIDCYYTDQTVHAIVTGEGETVYANGKWKGDWKDRTLMVAISEFIATTDRPDGDFSNPFCAWTDTERLLEAEQIDSEGAVRVLIEEAEAGDGNLAIDTRAHYINRAYESETDPGEPLPAVSGLKAKPAGMGEVLLTWSREEEADGYLILRGGRQIAYTFDNSFSDNGADPDAFNFYHVIPFRKQDGKIVKGEPGAYVWALGRRVGETRKVTAQVGTAGVKLTWEAVEGANGYVVLSKSGSDKAAFNPQAKTTSCEYVDTKAESGVTQFYWVYAVYNNEDGRTLAAGKASPYAWAVAK